MPYTPSQPHHRRPQAVDTTNQQWGSDYIVDLLNAYGFKYVPFNPGASFRGIEESIVNYADNSPEVVTTPNEGLTVSIAHGYAKATGQPSLCILHDVVGTLNGAMSIFNAYADRVPILILAGNGPVRKQQRRPWIDWIHTALDQGSLVREFTKWDDQPAHTDGVADSIIRAHNIAATRPHGPTYVTLDHDVQENPLDEPLDLPDLDQFQPPSAQAPDPASITEAAELLISAELPVILADRVGDSYDAVTALRDLAETLAIPVVNMSDRRYNFPTTHPLYLPEAGLLEHADLVLALDVQSLNRYVTSVDRTTHERTDIIQQDTQIIDIGMQHAESPSLIADYAKLRPTALSIQADTKLAVPALRDAVTDSLDQASGIADRRDRLVAHHETQQNDWETTTEEHWDDTPISLPRLASDLWDVINDDAWVVVNGTLRNWIQRVWDITEYDQYIGGKSGGAGVGYGLGGAIGGALAYDATDRIPINLLADGGLMQFMSGLWTIAHLDLPLFTLVHNNQTLYNSTEHCMNLAGYRNRDNSYDRALIGTGLTSPTPDYATIAEGNGITGYGPVTDPADLKPTLEDAWADVKNGEPVLVDVVAQPRSP